MMRLLALFLLRAALATNTSFGGSDTPPRTTAALGDTPAPSAFCLACGFDFGHIVDGVDDRAAGAALVGVVVLLVGALCFVAGCCCCGRRRRYASVKRDDEEDDDDA